MTAQILSGKQIAEQIKNEVKIEIQKLSFKPTLAVIRVGDDPASVIYVENKIKAAQQVGIISRHYHFPESISQKQLVQMVEELNQNPEVDGILIQLPLPSHIDENVILQKLAPEKDVDGFHPVNLGKLLLGQDALFPCTPAGVIELFRRAGIQVQGKHAVVIGRSNIVGKPMALLLLRENATVTICHSRSENLTHMTRQADILVVAIGKAGFICGDFLKEGVVVVDVGINQVRSESKVKELFEGDELERRLEIMSKKGSIVVGDVNQKDAMRKASFLTPVPGGVGQLTVAMLMKNTLKAAVERRKNL